MRRIGAPVRHRRQALFRQCPGVKLQPAGGGKEGLALPRADGDRLAIQQCRRIEARHHAAGALEHGFDDLRRRCLEDRVRQAQAGGEGLGQAVVRPRLALGFDHALAVLHVVRAIGAVKILALQIGRRGQHDIGEFRRFGHERVVDNGGQILPRETGADARRVGVGHGGVVGGDEQGADRRIVQFTQRLAEFQVVDGARFRRAGGLAHRVVVEPERGGGRQQRAAAVTAIRAGDARQQRDGAQILPAVGEAAEAEADADERGFGGAVQCRETLDVRDGEAGDRGGGLGREARQDLVFDLVEAERVARDVAAVHHAVADQDVHHAQGQRGIGADPHRQPQIGDARGSGAARVDDHQFDARGAAFLDGGPEMHVGGVQVGTPGHDQVGLPDRFRIGAANVAHGDGPGGVGAGVADSAAAQAATAQGVEHAVGEAAVDLTLMRAVGVAQKRQRP